MDENNIAVALEAKDNAPNNEIELVNNPMQATQPKVKQVNLQNFEKLERGDLGRKAKAKSGSSTALIGKICAALCCILGLALVVFLLLGFTKSPAKINAGNDETKDNTSTYIYSPSPYSGINPPLAPTPSYDGATAPSPNGGPSPAPVIPPSSNLDAAAQKTVAGNPRSDSPIVR